MDSDVTQTKDKKGKPRFGEYVNSCGGAGPEDRPNLCLISSGQRSDYLLAQRRVTPNSYTGRASAV